MIYCPIYQVIENLNRSHLFGGSNRPASRRENALCGARRVALRAPRRGARCGAAPHSARRSRLALRLLWLASLAPAPAPGRRTRAISRPPLWLRAYKIALLYNCWRALRLRRQGKGACNYGALRRAHAPPVQKTILYNCVRFRASNIVRAAWRGLYPPALVGALPPRGLRPNGFAVTLRARRATSRLARAGSRERRENHFST